MSARKGRSKAYFPLMNTTGRLVITDEEKAEVLENFFASVFTGNLFPHLSSGWTVRQGLREQSPSHCKRRSGS